MGFKSKIIGISALTLLSILNPVSSADAGLDEAVVAYEKGNFELAFKELNVLAQQGYVLAQYNLGVMYERGQGVKQDYFKAVEWYTKAAQQGKAEAQYNLGVMYENGRGVRKNLAQAKEWFGLACDNRYQYGCKAYAQINQ